MERELLPDRRQRLSLEEVPGVLVGAAGRLAVRALGRGPLVAEHHRLLRAFELGGGEAEALDPLDLQQQRLEAAGDAIVRDERLDDRLVLGPRGLEQTAIGGSAQERRVRALTELVEPGAEHCREQLVHHQIAVAADRALVAGRTQVADLDGRGGGLLIGHDREAGAGLFRDVVGRPRPLRWRDWPAARSAP